jgi:hypothetical protein
VSYRVEIETVSGESDIWGHLLKVGGDHDPKAVLRLRNQKLFAVEVTKAIVLELQNLKLIYKDVGLAGIATWRRDDWSLVAFRATAVLDYRPDETNPEQTFHDLARASGGRWDSINPDDYVNKLRSPSDQPIPGRPGPEQATR